jgi:hypothetical protein
MDVEEYKEIEQQQQIEERAKHLYDVYFTTKVN